MLVTIILFSLPDREKLTNFNIYLKHQVERNLVFKGGGVHPDYFVKLDFEIAVEQQTRARDRTFEGVPDPGCPPVSAGQSHPYLVNL